MSTAVQSRLVPPPPGISALGFIAGSILVHAVALFAAGHLHRDATPRVLPTPGELVEVEVAKPPPPEPEKAPPPAPKVKPPPIRVASVQKPPPPPKEKAPPPRNEDKPPEPQKAPPPLLVGVTLSSTTVAGGFAAPVGNTAYGKVADRATDAANVKPYSAPRYAPIYQVDRQPELVSEFKPPYPEEARRAGVEGRVTLQITIDETGKVTSAKVIQGVGYGLDEAAREGMLKARFKPAFKAGEPVATLLTFVYRFELP